MTEENWKALLSIPAKLNGRKLESAVEAIYFDIDKDAVYITGKLTREQLRAIVAWMDLEAE